tara:strand:- start:600 stop:1130 length:531 start_codon:yes stop_codon:yes gene_type:complete
MLIDSQSLNKIFFLKRIPFIFIFLFSCITSTFYSPLGYALNMPSVPIICIVYWCLRLGNLFNSFEIFILGALTDIIMGTPFGSYPLLYLIISSISNYFKQKFSYSNFFSHILIAFIIIFFCDFFFNLALTFLNKENPALNFLFLNYLLTISLYPAFYIIFKWVYKIFKLEKYYVEN